MTAYALTPADRRKLELAGLILPPTPPAPKKRNRYLKAGRLSHKECRAANICTRCRQAKAIHYSDFAGYGLWCPACIETRKNLRGRKHG